MKKLNSLVLSTRRTMFEQVRSRFKFFAVNLPIVVFVCQVECFECRFGIGLNMCKFSQFFECESAVAIQVVVAKSVGEGLLHLLVFNRALSPSASYATNRFPAFATDPLQRAFVFATAFHSVAHDEKDHER